MRTNTSRACALRRALVAALLMGATSAQAAGPEPAPAWDGLKQVNVKGLDQAYSRPGATLTGYRRILLDPVEVSFSKDWRPDANDIVTATRVTQADRDRIRADLASLVRREFSRTIAAGGGYPIAADPGPDVLRVRAHIVDLFINAPGVAQSGRVRSFVWSAGSMTLMVELYDSETGQLIARAVDRKVDPDSSWLTEANGVTNAVAATRAVAAWTRVLRRQLDSARAAVTSSPANR